MKTMISAVAHAFSENEAALIQTFLEALKAKAIQIADYDFNRPWGGFVLIEESDAIAFAETFFTGMELDPRIFTNKLSPKLLFVKPKARLSWQYHHRRSELWQVLEGPVGIVKSNTDKETPMGIYQKGARVTLAQGERHRLVGLDRLGIVAEFWQHTDPDTPSNEEDIIRLQDDHSRK